MALDYPSNHLLKAGVQLLLKGEDGQSNQWVAPNDGRYPLTHVETFMNRYTSLSRVYRDYDEALINSRDNARFMRNDVGVRECLDSRRRSVSLLNWHLEPEDEKSEDQKEFCKLIEKIIRRIRNFTDYRFSIQDAIWYGKMGSMHRWRTDVINSMSVWMPKGVHPDDKGWRPIQGDKLVFRQARPNMVPGAYEGQLGIRVGWMDHKPGDLINGRWRIESTDYGLAYFISPQERKNLVLVHKHHCEDAAYEDGLRAGSIHGVGIRSVIYWEWVQKQETQAYLMEFIERMSGGVQIWKYPMGNQQALAEIKASAEQYDASRGHVLLVPVPLGEDSNQYGVEFAMPDFTGIEALQNLIKNFFGNRVKRYILGQVLSSEAEATGMGSGVADLHMDTLLQIIKSDATLHEETLTAELVDSIIRINVDKKVFADPGFRPRFVVETEEPETDKKSEAILAFMQAGLQFRKRDVFDTIGMAMPVPGDDLTPLPQQGEQPHGKGLMPHEPKPDHGDARNNEDQPGKTDEAGPREAKDEMSANNGYSESHLQRYGTGK